MTQPHRRVLAALALAAAAACTIYTTPSVSDVPRPSADSVTIASPVKAHLLDGSTVVYRAGIVVTHDTVRPTAIGTAYRVGLTLHDSAPATYVPMDSVVGMEMFKERIDGAASTVLTVLALGAAAAVVIPVIECLNNPKCFGSCPTFYADSAGTPVLEAEGFSYSIAPLFEARDVDRLRFGADTTGALRLEVRDEALETHYINSIGLLEVRHGRDEVVVPDGTGRPLALREFAAPAAARDRSGRDVTADLSASDGRTYHTPAAILDAATAEDARDFVDVTFARPAGRDTVALVFRMRNSLLNTVLLYDLMLGDPGLRSLDWVGRDLASIGPAARLGRWYVDHMGLRVAVWDGAAYQEVARVADTGPVAWKDVAVRIPVPTGERLRVRLSFVADDWRIDQVRLAAGVRDAGARVLEPSTVLDRDGRPDTAALAGVRAADGRYLVTSPGERFSIRFESGAAPRDSARTFLLVSQGYYIEWLRGTWLHTTNAVATFEPTDATLLAALHRWRAEQPDLERRFAATRVPVR